MKLQIFCICPPAFCNTQVNIEGTKLDEVQVFTLPLGWALKDGYPVCPIHNAINNISDNSQVIQVTIQMRMVPRPS